MVAAQQHDSEAFAAEFAIDGLPGAQLLSVRIGSGGALPTLQSRRSGPVWGLRSASQEPQTEGLGWVVAV